MESMKRITAAVADYYQVSYDHLVATRRNRWTPSRCTRFVEPRWVAMWLVREMTGASYPEIGRFFGMDHTTIIHGCKRLMDRNSPRVEEVIDRVMFRATTPTVGHA